MQPDYKNWVPKGMVTTFFAATSISSFALGMSLISDTVKKPVKIALATVTGACAAYSAFCINWYNTFSYNGKKKFAKHIIDSIAEYVKLPDGGRHHRRWSGHFPSGDRSHGCRHFRGSPDRRRGCAGKSAAYCRPAVRSSRSGGRRGPGRSGGCFFPRWRAESRDFRSDQSG